jgi:Leucine Rich repeat
MSEGGNHVHRKAHFLPIFLAVENQQISLICRWLTARDIGNLDMAVSNKSIREPWLNILKSNSKSINDWYHSHSSIRWVVERKIGVTQILMNPEQSEDVSEMTFKVVDTSVLQKESNQNQKKMLVWDGCRDLQLIDLNGCRNTTDKFVSALADGCGQLQSINLSGCLNITDIGVTALGNKCRQLRNINLTDCGNITKKSVSALGRGCRKLQSINLSGCGNISDIGLSALGRGCGQLQFIDLNG